MSCSNSNTLDIVPSYLTPGPAPSENQTVVLDSKFSVKICEAINDIFNNKRNYLVRNPDSSNTAITYFILRDDLERLYILIRTLDLMSFSWVSDLYTWLASVLDPSTRNTLLNAKQMNYPLEVVNDPFLSKVLINKDYIPLTRDTLRLLGESYSEFIDVSADINQLLLHARLNYKPINTFDGISVWDEDYITLTHNLVKDEDANKVITTLAKYIPGEIGLEDAAPVVDDQSLEVMNYASTTTFSDIGINKQLLTEMVDGFNTFFNATFLAPVSIYANFLIMPEEMALLDKCKSLADQAWIVTPTPGVTKEVKEKYIKSLADCYICSEVDSVSGARTTLDAFHPVHIAHFRDFASHNYNDYDDVEVTVWHPNGKSSDKKFSEVKDVLATLGNIWNRAKSFYMKHEELIMAGIGLASGALTLYNEKNPDITTEKIIGFIDYGPSTFATSTDKAKYALNSKRLAMNVIPTISDFLSSPNKLNTISNVASKLLIQEFIASDKADLEAEAKKSTVSKTKVKFGLKFNKKCSAVNDAFLVAGSKRSGIINNGVNSKNVRGYRLTS